MKVVSDLRDAALDDPCVLSIGNFDGVHLGHRRILEVVLSRARALRVRSAVMTFDPHPMRVLRTGGAPRMITTLDRKLALLEKAGVDLVFVAPFTLEFAELSADAFIRRYLVEGLKAKALCVGGNFKFGYKQEGTSETLRRWNSSFELIEIPAVEVRKTVVSSTAIRGLVEFGAVSRASRLLGRWYELEGKIVGGEGRGRQVTVPTLNLAPANELIPELGVYITRASLDGGSYVNAITNVGRRPTFDGQSVTIETFLLDASPDQPAFARLQFLRRIRDERRFDSPQLLREQILRDVRKASRFFHLLQIAEHARTHSH